MTDHPNTPDPLDRLRAFDAVEPPEQWDDIVHRAETGDGLMPLALADESTRPRGRWVLASAAAVVLLVGAIVVVANRDDDGGIAPATVPPTTASDSTVPGPAPTTAVPTTTGAPTSTTAPTTTVPVSTTSPVVVTTPPTSAPSLPTLPCAPFDATPPNGEWSPLDPALGELGSLATEPNLVLSLTDTPPVSGRGVETEVDRVAGGIVVLVHAGSESGYTGWQLIVIDDSGDVRWQRCGTDAVTRMIVGPAGAERSVVDLPGPTGWHSFELATGADAAPLDVPIGFGWKAHDDRYLVVAPEGPASGEAGGPVQLVDLTTGAVTDLGTPPPGLVVYGYQVETRDDGSPLVTLSENPGYDVTLAVHVGGEWRTDRDALLNEVDIWVTETSEGDGTGNGPGLLGRDPLGATVWFEPTTGGLPGEGFHIAVVGDVVLANVCNLLAADGVCRDITFQARDLLTGELLWERSGYGSPLASSDRYVFTGSAVLDLRTGEDVQRGALPADTFWQGCCGEGTYLHTSSDGGVVWAVNYEQIQVFYPAASARPTARIDLTQ